ncbi:hypothetical protein CMK11_15980 [Candidatus Poribacteria bacterium]|nr:hypothetical protein [Candidatus Poribacteria bacterium]
MIKKILIGFGVVVAVALLLPVTLVLLNQNPFGLVERLPLVHSFAVKGDVRMTDGASLPEDKVTVRVGREGGRTVKGKATAKNDFAYVATFLGFRPPIADDDKITVQATMSAPASLLDQTDAAEGETVLLADYPARPAVASSAPDADRIILTDPKLRVSKGATPENAEEWGAVLLAGLRNLPNLQIDDEVTIVRRAHASERIAGDPPFQMDFPDEMTAEEARALRLSEVGEELARESFVWDKKSPSVGFNYDMARRSFQSVHIRDEDGVPIRSERLGKPGQAGTQTWVWDGKDNDGLYAPAPPTGKEYTFVAYSDSFDLSDDPNETSGFQAEILALTGPRIRYSEFSRNTTVGEFLDTFGLSLLKNVRGGEEVLELRESTLFHTARLVGDPEDTEAILRGDSTVADFVTAFGAELDELARSSRQIADFDLVIRGASVRMRLDFAQLRSRAAVTTRDEFLDLPLASIEAKQRQGYISLASEIEQNGPLNVAITRRLGAELVEDWEGGRSEQFEITLTGSDTLRGFLADMNKLENVTATVRGAIQDEFQYDVLLSAPAGQQVTYFLAPDETPNELRVNIRASGVMARLADGAENVPGDALTPVGIEAIVIGLDGSESIDDALVATATEGVVVDGGAMRYVDGAHRGQYTAEETTTDAEDTLVVAAAALQERSDALREEDKDRGGVLYKATMNVDVLGVEPAPVVVAPADVNGDGAPGVNGNGAAAPGATADGTTVPVAAAAGPAMDPRKMAKLYASLTPASAAELILAMPAERARPVLLGMPERDAGKIIEAILTGDVGETAASLGAEERMQSLMEILGASGERMLPSSP